jgi:hypothetical protein
LEKTSLEGLVVSVMAVFSQCSGAQGVQGAQDSNVDAKYSKWPLLK